MALLAAMPIVARGENSKLWGKEGELWNPAGPLPDFSFAGYRRGEEPIPDREPDVSVVDFGAVGDGTTDDTAAFQNAIAASGGKVIGIPPGRFLITGILEIKSSGTVLQGAGSDRTILICPKPLEEIRSKPLTGTRATTGYSWSGGIVWIFGSSFGRDRIASIQPGGKRGDKIISLADSASGLEAGQTVIVAVKDDADQSLVKYLYAGDPGDIGKTAPGSEERQQVCRIRSIEGDQVTLDRPLRYDLPEAFKPELRTYDPRLEECGVERIGFEFPEQPYGGHFSESGHNAISIQASVNCWARDIRILNADSGIFLSHARFTTVRDVIIESKRKPGPADCTGHHGIQVTGEDNLVTRFDFRTRFIHDLTVERTSGCVFSNGKGVDLSMDHHRRAPYENLFSNIDLGRGESAFNSGGSGGIGKHAGAGNTYWNLVSKERLAWPEDDFGPDRINWIALNTRERKSDDPEKTGGRWVEPIRPGEIEPADLHAAQLAKRTGKSPAATSTTDAPDPDTVHAWVNSEGQEVRAKFLGLKGDAVVLGLANGKPVNYPLAKLSPESQQLARKLSK